MSLTYSQAVDQMVKLLNEAWVSLTPALLGGPDPILMQWPGQPQGLPEIVQPFGRMTYRHVADPRHTLAPAGHRRFTRGGFIVVQCFGPIADAEQTIDGFSFAEKLAIIARDAYEGKGTDEGLWFRNAHINEIGADDVYYQHQARVDFTYDECK